MSSISDNKSDRIDDDTQSQQGLGESLYVPSQTQVINKDENKDSNLSEEREISLDSNKNSINFSNNNKDNVEIEKKPKNNENEAIEAKSPGNIINSLILEKKKNKTLNLEIDLEKSFKEKAILYEISTKIKNKSYNLLEKNILCCRRYKHFNLFYNLLKIRYPQYIFPKLTPKNYINKFDLLWSASDIKTFSSMVNQNDSLKKRRIELEYFINEVNNHFFINKSEEIKKFLKEIKFDEQYFESSVKSFYYPECEKKINNICLIDKSVNLINYFLGKKSLNDRINSKILLDEQAKLKNKLEKYKLIFNEIKNIFSCLKKEKEEKKNLSKNLSYLKAENFNDENNLNKKNFNELIEINKRFNNNKYDENLSFFEEEIVNPLDFCILNLIGEKNAIKRYVSFLDSYYKIIDYKIQEKDNKKIIEEQIKIKNDIDLYEETLIKEIKRNEEVCTKIFKDTIHKLYIYIYNSTEEFVEKYKNISFIASKT